MLSWLGKRPQRYRSRRQRPAGCKPRFDVPEGRCLPSTITVVNTADSGPGSLRQAIADARPGDTIDFDSRLSGSTITLTSSTLLVDKDLTILGPGPYDLTVSSGGRTLSPFTVNAEVMLHGLTIANANRTGISVQDRGLLNLRNCVVTNNVSGPGG